VIAILPSGSDHALDEKMLSNIQEVKARGARVIVIAHEGAEVVGAEHIIRIPACSPLFQPILATVPLQVFAYEMAVARGNDVDQPRNLAKSVTVE
jgi:glucosamine--fructose-6-phosphate aminotransferase (isomerizing)